MGSYGLASIGGAELMVMLKACKLFVASKWNSSFALIVESNCQIVMNWIVSCCCVPYAFIEVVSCCREFFVNPSLNLVFAYWEANDEAHNLAKHGVSRVDERSNHGTCSRFVVLDKSHEEMEHETRETNEEVNPMYSVVIPGIEPSKSRNLGSFTVESSDKELDKGYEWK
ncbi:hypothetical protein V6N12_010013 [Hibiscus sabdariffa]|uniref:RNase H type-1 domain-containing protein n=1 Tax=Hibiscus sabdariffa TaxID=183260 RepID=A0ABR2ECU3_9ROSI